MVDADDENRTLRDLYADEMQKAKSAGLSNEGRMALLGLSINPLSVVDAIGAINAYLDAGLQIPAILGPWVRKAVGALTKQSHVKGLLKAEATDRKKRIAVFQVVDLMSFGDTKDDAIKQVALMTGYSAGTLEEYYKDYQDVRQHAWNYAKTHPVSCFTVPPGQFGAGVTFTRKRSRTEPTGGRKKRRHVP